ncbi:MAG: hypothetical protein H0X14_00315 [Acidobacteria bacterium]|nr:hypothetical protein [Acidobacteriota bacterium]
MRHKWMAALVVLITTVVTAQEAVKQYDDLKEQAGAWATSRLWASFLSTNAAEEELIEEQAVACSVTEIAGDHSPQQKTLMPAQVNHVKSTNNVQQHSIASHTIRIELPALKDKQHNNPNPAGEAALEHISEVALLTEQAGGEMEEPGQPETQTTEQDAAEGDERGDYSIVHAEQREVSFTSRTLSNVAAEEALLTVDASTPVPHTIAATEAQAKAIKRAVKVLRENVDRSRRIELRIIRRERRVETQNGTSMSLRAQISSGPSATTFTGALWLMPINSQLTPGLSADGACASEE